MNTTKKQLLEKTYNAIITALNSTELSLLTIEEYIANDLMRFGSGINEISRNKTEFFDQVAMQKKQVSGLSWKTISREAVFRKITGKGNVAIFVDELTARYQVIDIKQTMTLRLSYIFEYNHDKWVLLHFHGSTPSMQQAEGEFLPIEVIKQKNAELEKIVAERTVDLKRSLDTLKSTQAQLIQKEKLASLGELTAGIAHEIQNPLNFVNNFSELSVDLVKDLKEEIEKPKQDKEYIGELFNDLSQNQEKINHHGKRASSIVKGMLEHSRASTGVKELTDINKLADEYLRLSYHGLRAKDKDFNADFTTDFDENLPKIEVIPQDIGRVLLNLINNAFYAVAPPPPKGELEVSALKYSKGESYVPTVTVSTHYQAPLLGAGGAGSIIIKVKDNGTGMSESVRAKVFQPFFTTKPTGQGTGLGLSLAYDIVTKGHGGTLEVESTEGVGSEFTITLPFKTNGL